MTFVFDYDRVLANNKWLKIDRAIIYLRRQGSRK